MEIQTKDWIARLEYRSEIRGEDIVFIVSLNDEELYVGDEIRNIVTLFVTIGSLSKEERNDARHYVSKFLKKGVVLAKEISEQEKLAFKKMLSL